MEPREVVAAYGASWNELNEAKRSALLEQAFAREGTYRDPTGSAAGRAALVSHIGGFQVMFPGRSIAFASGVDVTEAGIRWSWVMRNGDQVEMEGMDFAELGSDGRIQRIVGFFGPRPLPED